MGFIGEPDPLVTAQQHLLDDLAEEAGGYDVLDSLDNAPIPDEEFAWDGVPADVRDQVAAMLGQCDRCADELLGPEYRTACRRLLARAAPSIPGTSLGSARPELVAAAVCWVIGRGNHLFGTRPGELKVREVPGMQGPDRILRHRGINGFTARVPGHPGGRPAGLGQLLGHQAGPAQPAGLRTPTVDHHHARPVPSGHRRLTQGSPGNFPGSGRAAWIPHKADVRPGPR